MPVKTLDAFVSVLRAVDPDGRESASLHCWSFTRTTDISSAMKMSVQEVTPILRGLADEGYLTRTEQPDGTLTWHLRDKAVRLLGADASAIDWAARHPRRRA